MFATFYGLPHSREEDVNDEASPHLMRWLRACHVRPGLQAALRMGKGFVTERAAEVRRRIGVPETVAA